MAWQKAKRDPADAAFSKYVRARDKWQCQRCLKQFEENAQNLHASHFQGRRKESTRYEPLNVDALCAYCHGYFTSFPGEHYQWQVQRKGQETVDKIILQSNTYLKKDRKAQAIVWRAKIKEL